MTLSGQHAGNASERKKAGLRQQERVKLTDSEIAAITRIAKDSDIARYHWINRGIAPPGYIKGMAVAYALAYRRWEMGDSAAREMARADTGNAEKDALAFYRSQFAAAGMSNKHSGIDTLRHLYVMLIGLGMRESSGRHCCGRDRSADNTTSNTCEAGLFQTSWNISSCSPVIPKLFDEYASGAEGYMSIFKEGVKCSSEDRECFGSGKGYEYQKMSKEQPTFNAEVTAVGLRHKCKHWGPIKRLEVEIKSAADKMLLQVQEQLAAPKDH